MASQLKHYYSHSSLSFFWSSKGSISWKRTLPILFLKFSFFFLELSLSNSLSSCCLVEDRLTWIVKPIASVFCKYSDNKKKYLYLTVSYRQVLKKSQIIRQFAAERLKRESIRIKWQPTHKTAHLQTAQPDTQPKFAKELFSCRHTTWLSKKNRVNIDSSLIFLYFCQNMTRK